MLSVSTIFMSSVLEWKITFELHLQFVGDEVKMIYLLEFTLKNALVSTLFEFWTLSAIFGYDNKMICFLKLPKIGLMYGTRVLNLTYLFSF